MKLLMYLILAILILGVGGMLYIAMTDMPVEQKTVTKEIPHDRLSPGP